MNSYLLRHFIFPSYHYVKFTGVMPRLREFKRNQWLTPDELLHLQKSKLRDLLEHALVNVPFYRKRFQNVGFSLCDLHDPVAALQQLPLLTKQEINAHRSLLIAENIKEKKLISNSTSGSTGESLRFFTDLRSSACRRAVVIRNQEWLGIKLGDRQALLWGAAIDIDKLKNIRGRVHRWFNNYIILSSYNLSHDALGKYVAKLKSFSPLLLTSYPGPLVELAEFMLKNKLHIPSLKAVISSAETLYPWQKKLAEQALSCPVYNRYGCREFGDIAHECKHRQGLHLNVDRCLVEILDDDGNPCQPGMTGEIVVTDLDNYGMPFIRYRIGDQGRFATNPCSCGRGFSLLEAIEGRTLDIIRAPNGQALGGTFWTILFRSRPGIKAFQVIQTQIDGITVKYVADRDVSNIPFHFFTEQIREKCGADFLITYQMVDEIKKTASGKSKMIVAQLSADKH